MLMQNRKKEATLGSLLKRIHSDEEGAVSIETVLILAAIALPILIFIIKVGWPQVKSFFKSGLNDLEGEAVNAASDGFTN